ncbi:MAG: hypothetical protein CME70_19080 [Halobacteriovorax sp.]|nr:hypothetical protein [Halobacteriovorax sp.]|tara:strand:- start:651 stop:860 length:210 start_codon:yes stop_codon:yes gene_type:complete
MKIGDLVEYNDHPDESQGRTVGIITNTDVYRSRNTGLSNELIVEVLWDVGIGWILQRRVRLVNEVRRFS